MKAEAKGLPTFMFLPFLAFASDDASHNNTSAEAHGLGHDQSCFACMSREEVASKVFLAASCDWFNYCKWPGSTSLEQNENLLKKHAKAQLDTFGGKLRQWRWFLDSVNWASGFDLRNQSVFGNS